MMGDPGSAMPLTHRGARFELVPSMQEILCLLDDGRLLVSRSHLQNPSVKAFVARLERISFTHVLHPVEMSDISQAYAGARVTARHEVSGSDMQNYARELFRRAVKLRASDVHIRVSSRSNTRILFRIHNDLEFQEEQTYEFGHQLCTTIYQAMADVADATYETLSSQDARISDRSKIPFGLDGIRVATSPQVDGHVMVLRMLYNDANNSSDTTSLGYTATQAQSFYLMKKKPTGINIVGGPTGSGKSTTLQRLLSSIIRESLGRKNVITVEDPPEYPIPGAVQTPVTNVESEEERARAFQSAIKAAMRLDPDVIMIGEVRDTPSAKLAVQAAMTGHQVWTTLHANGAFQIVDRLVDLGVPAELVCDPAIVTGLTCQRLLKVLCPHCRQPLDQVQASLDQFDVERVRTAVPNAAIYVRGTGCGHCGNAGITGRTVVAETILTDEPLMTLLRRGDRPAAIDYWRAAMRGQTMLDHAVDKIAQGLVDPFQAEDIVGLLDGGVRRLREMAQAN
ncbi:MAG: type secretion system protein [Paucimonas sp.]|nr:type secretion system protein [Paucimonas sp.]